MATNQDSAHGDNPEQTRLESARVAARAFCRHFAFPKSYVDRVEEDPIQKPLVIERKGTPVEVFRWLGHGRGEAYVQVELGVKTNEVTVYGALRDREFGPWKP